MICSTQSAVLFKCKAFNAVSQKGPAEHLLFTGESVIKPVAYTVYNHKHLHQGSQTLQFKASG